MSTVGIICEYNPIHNGHIYQFSRVRELLGDDTAIICAMSGSFVQRGDFAVFSKSVRAQAAVMSGADLVLELPTCVSLSSAEGFALGAVRLLNSLGVCTHLAFGSEAGELAPLAAVCDALKRPEVDSAIKSALKTGVSYPAARHTALKSHIGRSADVIALPNNILAVEYLKALDKTGSSMSPIAIRRRGGEHDGERGNSASAIRRELFAGNSWQGNVPECAYRLFRREIELGRGPVSMKNAEAAVLYRLRTMCREEYMALPGDAEGLSLRLMKFAVNAGNVEEILEKAATKRYAVSRLRRMMLCAYLGVTARDMGQPHEFVRILAASRRGTEILRRMKKNCALPAVIKPARGMELPGSVGEAFRRECAISGLYALGFPGEKWRDGCLELSTSPYIMT